MSYIIYKIDCKDENIKEVYIGSTKNLNKRIIQHRTRCNNNSNYSTSHFHYKIYKFMRANGGFDNFKFSVLEIIDNTDKSYILEREKYWIKSHDNTLNVVVPTRTNKEWIEDNLQKRREYKTAYRQVKVMCECGKEMMRGSLRNHKKICCGLVN